MAYQRLDIVDGETVLVAAQISHIEDGIVENESNISQNTTDIKQNTTDISQNTTDIKQNTTDISTINTDLSKLPTQIQSGAVTVTPSSSGTNETVSVTFPTSFSSAPAVFVTCQSGYPSQVYACISGNPTTTGFTLAYGRSSGSSAFVVRWVAILQ